MLKKFTVLFEPNEASRLQQASLYHGWLMTHLSDEIAAKMHQTQTPLFSQFISIHDNCTTWTIHTWNDSVSFEIDKLLAHQKFIYLKHNQQKMVIDQVSSSEVDESTIINDNFFATETPRFFTIEFVSPTAFKSEGQYVYHPDMRLLLNSLMNKVDANIENASYKDYDVFISLIENCVITNYNLHTLKFSLEGTRIPAFIGKIEIKCSGPKQMRNFFKMLLKFGEYTGLGVKTALGMGAIRYQEKYYQRKKD